MASIEIIAENAMDNYVYVVIHCHFQAALVDANFRLVRDGYGCGRCGICGNFVNDLIEISPQDAAILGLCLEGVKPDIVL